MAPPKNPIGRNPISKRRKGGEGSSRNRQEEAEQRDIRAVQRNVAQEGDDVQNPVLSRAQITELRGIISLQNCRWAKGKKSFIPQAPHSHNILNFINKYAEWYYEDSGMGGKSIARTKMCRFSSFTNEYPTIRGFFEEQGWMYLWEHAYVLYDDDIIQHFYANMWVQYDVERKPIAVNSLIRGRHFRWTPNDICRLLHVREGGWDYFSCGTWNDEMLGVSMKEVKTYLGVWPKYSLLAMTLEHRILSVIVAYCICGKSGKMPSNMDYFFTYKIARREPLNFGAILIQCLIESITQGNKKLVMGNWICKLLIQSGLPSSECNSEVFQNDFDIDNISQIVTLRKNMDIRPTKMARGRGQESPDPNDYFDDAEAARLAEEGEPSNPEGNTGAQPPRRYTQAEFDEIRAFHETRYEALEQKTSKMQKSIGKLKKFIKDFIPGSCFSSDEE